jgi:elongation factor G
MLRANTPLAQLFGFKRNLSSITNGRGSFAMRFSHYAEVPRGLVPTISGVQLACEGHEALGTQLSTHNGGSRIT